jgi:hypothetical protein
MVMGDSELMSECECGVIEGQLHEFGCRWEYCPFCEEQFVANCDCAYELLGLMSRRNSPEFAHLPQEVYEEGLSEEQEERWFEMCVAKGRIPFISTPQLCARCGSLWPEFFVVQDRVWSYYTDPGLRDQIICEPCFKGIREAVDAHNTRPSWLPSDGEIEEYIRAWRDGDKEALKRLEPEKFRRQS